MKRVVASDEEPIRAELFSVERLEQFARELAIVHKTVVTKRGRTTLLTRLEDNATKLVAAYRALVESPRKDRSIAAPSEWLIDNFHIVEQQFREIRKDLPKGFYGELPKLATGELAGYPRIYDIALAFIAHTDSRLDIDNLKRFIRAYQDITQLTIGEVWAIAIMLRVAFVENLKRIASRIVTARRSREEADALADKVLERRALPSEKLIEFLEKGLKREAYPAFVVQFVQRLRDQDPAVAVTLEWLDQQLARSGKVIEEIVQLEHQRQAAAEVMMDNIITSMRLLSALDWKDFFESVNLIDPLLKMDPAGAYALMDFATRDHYRHEIERLSKRTGLSELTVGQRALDLAADAQRQTPESKVKIHVGYYLIDEGLPRLERELHYQLRPCERAIRLLLKHPTVTYLGSIGLITLTMLTLIVSYGSLNGIGVPWLAAVAALFLVPVSDLAVRLVNSAIPFFVSRRPLPKIDVTSPLLEGAATLVVVPSILLHTEEVHELLEKLEVHYLANHPEHFQFALLSDFADAPTEQMPGDEDLLRATQRGIDALNARYCSDSKIQRFHLFHRRRLWNPSEGKWMGWERKRGKLHELNRLLRGASDTTFIIAPIADQQLLQTRYVITLDSDTQLPRDSASRLLGTALHPLNQPRFDERLDRVTGGYGIFQPRIGVSRESGYRSRFARIFVGNTGVDPYTTAVSDVYQNLFREGIYTGKGLYDIDAFETSLGGRIPENKLLTHHLFEGLFARVALVTDIELIDDYPFAYQVHARRHHRWTRGDWQVSSYLFSGLFQRQSLPLTSGWKILDNLRRSLLAPMQLLCLIAAWGLLPGSPTVWTVFVLLSLVQPISAELLGLLINHPRGLPWKHHLVTTWQDLTTSASRLALDLTFIAHQAYLMSDAIVRTLYRMLISHRHLLEWMTAAQDQRRATNARVAYLRFMLPAQVISVVSLLLVLLLKPGAIFIAAPFLIAWAFSPLIAHWISRITIADQEVLTAKEKATVRRIARSTWRYFETMVGEEDHWLPPDNYQEDPQPVVAHRTSPTNVGMLLLSSIAAHDFGYTATLELIDRLELTFSTLEKLPRYRGHFFNWYDTRSLEPLTPQYVSSVDSGNLAGHLMVIKQRSLDVPDCALLNEHIPEGLRDTVSQMASEVEHLGSLKQRSDALPIRLLREEVSTCAGLVLENAASVSEWSIFLAKLRLSVNRVQDIVNVLAQEHGDESFTELRFWVGALLHQTESVTRDLETLIPWAHSLRSLLVLENEKLPVELKTAWQKLKTRLDIVPAPSRLTKISDQALVQLAAFRPEFDQWLAQNSPGQEHMSGLLDGLATALENSAGAQRSFMARTGSLARLCERFIQEMDFGFLFDEKLKVLTVGYNVSDGQRDNSFYHLLASEARLTSFVAIATGDVPQEHWFRLGRQLTTVQGRRALISWSGTMFEYLMPLLVMRSYKGTLLDETYETVVAAQIAYGRQHGIPWGISESAYNARNLHLTYQYGSFGMPGLGLKRGLGENIVVAPYATMLAPMIRPHAALSNLARLEREGARSHLGFYEALDYTPDRVPRNQRHVIVRAFMTHHQGMSMVALDNLLNDRIMQRRFHSEPQVQADELLLQERIPRAVPTVQPRAAEVAPRLTDETAAPPSARRYATADLPWPGTQLLSNGTYTVMFTTAGGGYSTYRGIGVTRWREDATRDHWGSFCYLRDVRSGAVWSATYQPTTRTPQAYEVLFAEDKVDVWREDVGITTHTELIVSAEDNAEVRRISITNNTARKREIEFTSYAEVTLTNPALDASHPAFSNLFIETEFSAPQNSLLAHRRNSSTEQTAIWGVHVIAAQGNMMGGVQYETDRSRFLGRGHTSADPIAVIEDRPLSNTVGPVLDPIFSLRRRVLLEPGETARFTLTTAVAKSREEALGLADKYHAVNFEREARLAWTRAQVEMSHLGIDVEEAHLFQKLAGRVLYSNPNLRPSSHILGLNSLTPSALWQHGISGDMPIVLVRINNTRDLRIVQQLLRGHEYLRLKGLIFDLIILNDHPASYFQELQSELETQARKSGSHHLLDKPGGIFLRRADIMPEADRILLHSVARVVLVTERGSLSDQLLRSEPESELPPEFIPRWPPKLEESPQAQLPELLFFNGLGGFSQNGREYVTVLGQGQWTPAPWSNVVANPSDFGFVVSENGSGFTWSGNSRDNRLTPWTNDVVSDPPGEIIYLRDEDTGAIWTPTPLPIRETTPYIIRHGQGYSVFEHLSNGISQELLMFVPLDSPVKIIMLRLRNRSGRKRRLSLTAYLELVLGTQRANSAPFVMTEVDPETGAIFARNPYNNEFAGRITFAATGETNYTVTCDRREFLGRNGSPARPAALRRTSLSGRIGAGLDPCIAIQSHFELAPEEVREILVLLGQSENIEQAREIVSSYRQPSVVNAAFEQVLGYWDELLGSVEISTPDPAMDLIVNRWLPYQTLSCRLWARSAFYQSSGAYGFRDQLQDVMALVYNTPQTAREHILRAAGHQFKEGDVQHWWHPPTGRGLRTRLSDDKLWLPFATSFYIKSTGDKSVLDEMIPFIESALLDPDQEESYTQPSVSSEYVTLFDHCLRAIDLSLVVGRHGLPLMGSGDWNNGMNRVGRAGQGESTWLGWFLYTTLKEFVGFCDERSEQMRAEHYRKRMNALKKALAEEAWDGDWFRRAYFDDGTPLGSSQNDDCRIDSISQSWGVISGAAEHHHAIRAMQAVDEYLLRRGDGLVLSFQPPFDKTTLDPGYIKDYAPGVQENGGQSTQAGAWILLAFAQLGNGDRAWEIFSLLNPINHSSTRAGAHKYKVEPYVAAGDICANPPHTGRGGSTWYTGAAAWIYRAGLESILGFKLRGDRLSIEPCIPRSWRGYEIIYRHANTTYRIKIENPHAISSGVEEIELDGERQTASDFPLAQDGRTHNVRVILAERSFEPVEEVLIESAKATDEVRTRLEGARKYLSVGSLKEIAGLVDEPQWQTEAFAEASHQLIPILGKFDLVARHISKYLANADPRIKMDALRDAMNSLQKLEEDIKASREPGFRSFLDLVDGAWWPILYEEQKNSLLETVAEYENPFVAGPPIQETHENIFIGRADVVNRIVKVILSSTQPPPLLLYGARRMGKSSILNQLPRLLEPDFVAAKMDCQNPSATESLNSLLRFISRELAKGLKRRRIIITPLKLTDFGENPFSTFEDWLDQMEGKLGNDIRVLLSLDEYENLRAIEEKDWGLEFLNTMRSNQQHRPRMVWMLTGAHRIGYMGSEWISRFNSAYPVRVSFLPSDDVELLLTEPTSQLRFEYAPEALSKIIGMTNGHPYLTQALARELVDILYDRKRKVAALGDVEVAIKSALESCHEYFAEVWYSAAGEGQTVLRAIAAGHEVSPASSVIGRLRESDVLNDVGEFAVPLLKLWVQKEHLKKKIQDLLDV